MLSTLYVVYTILNLKLKFKNYLNLSISLELSSITFVATFFVASLLVLVAAAAVFLVAVLLVAAFLLILLGRADGDDLHAGEELAQLADDGDGVDGAHDGHLLVLHVHAQLVDA